MPLANRSDTTPRAPRPSAARPQPADAALANAKHLLTEAQDFVKVARGPDDATSIRQPLIDWAKGAATSLVVVGEVGRGKSTLVNALLGLQDASPTGAGETTAAYLRFRQATAVRPAGTVLLEFKERTSLEIDRSELARWTTVNGLLALAPGEAVPMGAEVSVQSVPIDGAIIVDTPGTSGLNEAHAHVAFDSAQGASVLVFVTGAASALTKPELDFLRQCADWVASIVVVLNKSDTADPSTALATNRRLLADNGLASADVVAFSAAFALRAALATDPELAGAFRTRSNLAGLLAVLRGHAGHADLLPYRNALRRARTLVAGSADELRARHGALTRAQQSPGAADAEDAKLADQQQRLTAAGADWDVRWGTLDLDLNVAIKRAEIAFEASLQAMVNSYPIILRQKQMAAIRYEIGIQYEAACTTAFKDFTALYGRLANEFFSAAGLEMPPRFTDLIQSASAELSRDERAVARDEIGMWSTTAGQAMSLARTVSMAAGHVAGGAGGAAVLGVVFSWTLVPLTAGLGGLAVAGRVASANRQELMKDVATVRTDLVWVLGQMKLRQSQAVRTHLRPAFLAETRTAQVRVTARRAELRQSVQQSERRRQEQAAPLLAELQTVDDLVERITAGERALMAERVGNLPAGTGNRA